MIATVHFAFQGTPGLKVFFHLDELMRSGLCADTLGMKP